MIIRYEKKTGWILSIMEDFVPEPELLEGTELLKISNEDAPENFRNIYATENGYKIINGEIRKKKPDNNGKGINYDGNQGAFT